jgi:predicted RNase H-like nuclease (RuvC/YqgF family)
MHSPLSSQSRSRFSWAGRFSIALLSALFLLNLPAFAQSSPQTPPLGVQDYQDFKVNLAIAKARFLASQQALQSATQENAIIKAALQQAQQQQQQHNSDSTQSSTEESTLAASLTKQLQDSNNTVSELRGNLESAAKDYDQQLQQDQVKAKALERENLFLKIGIGVCAAVTVGAIVYAVAK